MFYIRTILFGLFFLLMSLSSVHADVTIDDLAKTVVFISDTLKKVTIQTPQGPVEKEVVSTGTGVLVGFNDFIYLVTAAHIAKNTNYDSVKVFFNAQDKKLQSISLKDVKKNLPNSKWFFHKKADIAVHPLFIPEGTTKDQHGVLPQTLFTTKDENIPLATELLVLGFPFGLGTMGYLTPILRNTQIGSGKIKVPDPGGNIHPDVEVIILADPLAGGYSGSPVFISWEIRSGTQVVMSGGPPPMLVGIQSGVLFDHTGGKMSYIVPAFYLLEIFNSDEFKEYEKSL